MALSACLLSSRLPSLLAVVFLLSLVPAIEAQKTCEKTVSQPQTCRASRQACGEGQSKLRGGKSQNRPTKSVGSFFIGFAGKRCPQLSRSEIAHARSFADCGRTLGARSGTGTRAISEGLGCGRLCGSGSVATHGGRPQAPGGKQRVLRFICAARFALGSFAPRG